MSLRTLALRYFLPLGLLATAASCAAASKPSTDNGGGVTGDTSPTTPAGGETTGDDDDGSEKVKDGTKPKPTSPPLPSGVDPFAPQVDESAGLTNVSKNLDALLERGALASACEKYRNGAKDRKTKLLCGKWMYFYESFGTAGAPAPIVKFLAKNFPDELGLGFSKLGMIPDPSSADHIPLGMAPTTPISNNVDALAYTCASCHFGRLPDGRYAVGAPNHDYDYAGQILAIAIAPALGMGTGSASAHDPAAVAKVQPVLDKLKGDFALKAKFGAALLPLLSLQNPGISKDVEAQYASWPRGTLDFIIAPLPIDDGVEVVGKMIGLWNIPRDEEAKTAGMKNAMLAWTGAAKSLHEFLGGFAIVGGTEKPSDEDLEPLAEYIYSLRAPTNPSPPDAKLVADGAKLFESKGCIGCHDGPRGSGKRTYTFDEIGTDDTLAGWMDSDLDGEPCCGLENETDMLTHEVKSPRLVGMWALKRFLHNGSLSSLEQLFCLESRPAGKKPLSSSGHMYSCDGLDESEKRSLIAYLLAH